MKYVLYAIIIYIAFQFIFRLVFHVFIASRKIKKGFREMHRRMQEQMDQSDTTRGRQDRQSPPGSSQKHEDEYIDFEEVK